jgi:peptidoglycan/LPS O-acetylase OafA/YrhL
MNQQVALKSSLQHLYRPDIDGLRAIAVLAVIIFHANSRFMPGGFIGVDIFFVISGYLITGLIATGIENNTFTFTDFYTRRIKRIFPAYIVVALLTLIGSSYLLIPNDYVLFTSSLAASWVFVSNIFFSLSSWGYFGSRTEEFPLLHTWSLSVEEQFYFVFPTILILLYRYFRTQLIPVLVVMGILCVAYSEYKTGQKPTYFLLTTRAHELIIGALAFFISQRRPVQNLLVSNVLALLGVGLMLGSLFLINRNTAFPGINSLYPCLGTALVIYACSMDNAITPLLKHKWMVAMGLISYSLYLWHWPIFSFLRYRKIELSFGVAAAAVALTFILAYLTWKFIETPIRKNKNMRFKQAFTQIYLLPTVAFMSVGLYSYMTEGAPKRFSADMRELISSYSFERDLGRTCSVADGDYRKIDAAYLLEHCAFGDTTQSQAQILLLGDSHANHFKPFLEQLASNAKLKAVYNVQGSCSPIDFPVAGKPASAESQACQKRNLDMLELASNYKYVALGGFWSSKVYTHDFQSGMITAVDKIRASGAIPVIFKDSPYYKSDMSQCILQKKRGWITDEQSCDIPYQFVQQTQAAVDQIIDQIKIQHPEILVVDAKKIMCNQEVCPTYIENLAVYKDINHINAKAAKFLGDQYIQQIANPFTSKF